MTLQTTFKDDWLEKLLDIRNKHFTGQFFIKSNETFWNFQVSFGWIFYATRGSTKIWQRRLLLYCPQLGEEQLLSKFLSRSAEISNSWEYHFLFGLVESNDITKHQAEQIISLNILEALSEVLNVDDQVEESYRVESNLSDPPLVMLDPEKLIIEIRGLSQIWQAAKMPGSSFKLAPVLRQPMCWRSLADSAYQGMTELLDGRHTLWDLAIKKQYPVSEVAQLIIPHILSGVLELIEVSDLPISTPLHQLPAPSEALALRKEVGLSEYEERDENSEHKVLKKNRQRWNILFLSVGFLSLLLIGGGFWLWRMRTQNNKSTVAVSAASQVPASPVPPSSDIQPYNLMRDVPKVPRGRFTYGGAIVFAPLRSQKVVDAIAKAQPQFMLQYTEPIFGAPGSHKAIAQLIDNQLSFAQSALPLSDSEYERAKSHGVKLQQVPIGITGIVFYTNLGLNIPGLSLDQLQAIYTGKLQNWSQVGGPNLPITPIAFNPTNSSTMNILLSNVGGVNSMSSKLLAVRDWTSSIRLTSQTPGAISFGSMSSVKGQQTIRPIAIAKVNSTLYIQPYDSQGQINAQAVRDGIYPMTYQIFVDIRRDGTPDEQAGVAYANLLLSEEGQKLVEQAGFVTLH